MKTNGELLTLRDKLLDMMEKDFVKKYDNDKWKAGFAALEHYSSHHATLADLTEKDIVDYWVRGCRTDYIAELFDSNEVEVCRVLRECGFIAPEVDTPYSLHDVNAILMKKFGSVDVALMEKVLDVVKDNKAEFVYVVSDESEATPRELELIKQLAHDGVPEYTIALMSGRELGDVLSILGYSIGLTSLATCIKHEFSCGRSIEFIQSMFRLSTVEVITALQSLGIPAPLGYAKDFDVTELNSVFKYLELSLEKIHFTSKGDAFCKLVAETCTKNSIIPRHLIVTNPKYVTNMEIEAIKALRYKYCPSYVADMCGRSVGQVCKYLDMEAAYGQQ